MTESDGWVALLRGINLASRNRIPMAGLRALFAERGCEDVETYIASGNVVFRRRAARADLARELEQAVQSTFGVTAAVVLRTFAEIHRVARSHPFGDDTSQTFVTFLVEKPKTAAVRALAGLDVAPDEVRVVGAEVYVRHPDGLRNARLTGSLLERRLGVPGTARNWRTVSRLAELAAARA